MSVGDFITSPPGRFCVLLLRMFLASLFICGSIGLFDFKKFIPFFTFKRVASLFLLMFGLRLLIDSILFFNII